MMIIFENIQLSLVSASALALLISLFISFLLIKTNTNFKFGSQDQKVEQFKYNSFGWSGYGIELFHSCEIFR